MTEMRQRLTIILLAVMVFCSCKVNNGDIGDFFGSWLMYSMTVDGDIPEDFNPEQTYWEFQNNLICISRVEFMYDKESRWGTWSEDDNELRLNYTHCSQGLNPGTGQYRAPDWLGFPPNRVLSLSFVARSSNRMSLTWTDDNGRIYVYSLRKIW